MGIKKLIIEETNMEKCVGYKIITGMETIDKGGETPPLQNRDKIK